MAPPSASHPHRQPYEYLDALLAAIPNDAIPPEITASPYQGRAGAHLPYSKFIDAALRLASGGPARPDDAPQIRDAWLEIQTTVQRALHALHPSSSSSSQQPAKRKHSPPSSLPSTINNNGNNNKKPKYEDGGDDKDDDGDGDGDVPQLTLHAISATAPVRHKVDITLHARTLRLAHSTTGAPTARCARTAFTRVFLLPTRARSSGALQWTAVLLAGDKPAPPAPKAKAKATAAAAAAVRFELTCSVPDSSTIPRMTVHPPTSSSSSSSTPTSQVTTAREAVFTLLSSTISGTPVALTTVERAAPLAGITAHRGVRETSLWFFEDGSNANAGAGAAGILADGRPAEFWALEDLARGEAGVRVRTATGRTCSVVLMRRRSGDDGTGESDGEEEEEEGEEGEEMEFQMIDGKERERILEWVRRHRGAFGIAKKIREDEGDDDAQAQAQALPRGAVASGKDGGEDSDSDSDFEASGESDGGSPSSGSGSDVGSDAADADADADAGTDEDESRSGDESGGDEGDDDDEEIATMEVDDPDDPADLDPKHHPLLRAGALPKMSRAAMDAAVQLVVGDLVGQRGEARLDAPSPSPSVGSGLELDGREGAVAGAGEDDEEDELED
jgi:hypothetical protein